MSIKSGRFSLVWLGIAVFSFACSIEEQTDDIKLNGIYGQPCESTGVDGIGSTKDNIEANSTTFTVNIGTFSDSACATPLSLTKIVYNYTLGEGQVGENVNIDLTPVSATETALSTTQVDSNNTASLCNFTDWTINVEKNVFECYGLSGQIVYSIIQVDKSNEEFYMGNGEGSTAETRPATLEDTSYKKGV